MIKDKELKMTTKEVVNWFGNYQFGAELIIYNALISFVFLYFISVKSKSL